MIWQILADDTRFEYYRQAEEVPEVTSHGTFTIGQIVIGVWVLLFLALLASKSVGRVFWGALFGLWSWYVGIPFFLLWVTGNYY